MGTVYFPTYRVVFDYLGGKHTHTQTSKIDF